MGENCDLTAFCRETDLVNLIVENRFFGSDYLKVDHVNKLQIDLC